LHFYTRFIQNSSVCLFSSMRWTGKEMRKRKCVTLIMFRIIHSSHLAYFERESGAMTNVFFPFLETVKATAFPHDQGTGYGLSFYAITKQRNVSKRSESGIPAYRPHVPRDIGVFSFQLFSLIPLSGKFYVKRFRRDRLTALVGKV